MVGAGCIDYERFASLAWALGTIDYEPIALTVELIAKFSTLQSWLAFEVDDVLNPLFIVNLDQMPP